MNVFQRLHEEYLAVNARVRTLETQVRALERDRDETQQTLGRLGDLVRARLEALDQRIHSLEKAQAPRTRPWDQKPASGDEDPFADGTGQTPPDAHDTPSRLAALLEGWTQLCQAESKDSLTCTEALQALNAHPEAHQRLRSLLLEGAPDRTLPNPRSLGHRLAEFRDRSDGGRVLTYRTRDGLTRWYVRPEEPTPARESPAEVG